MGLMEARNFLLGAQGWTEGTEKPERESHRRNWQGAQGWCTWPADLRIGTGIRPPAHTRSPDSALFYRSV